MWKIKPNFDYSVYYGKEIQVYYNTSGLKCDEKENKISIGILDLIHQTNIKEPTVVILEKKININSPNPYCYEVKISITANLIQHVKVKENDIEVAVKQLCNDVVGVYDVHVNILELIDLFVEI